MPTCFSIGVMGMIYPRGRALLHCIDMHTKLFSLDVMHVPSRICETGRCRLDGGATGERGNQRGYTMLVISWGLKLSS